MSYLQNSNRRYKIAICEYSDMVMYWFFCVFLPMKNRFGVLAFICYINSCKNNYKIFIKIFGGLK